MEAIILVTAIFEALGFEFPFIAALLEDKETITLPPFTVEGWAAFTKSDEKTRPATTW